MNRDAGEKKNKLLNSLRAVFRQGVSRPPTEIVHAETLEYDLERKQLHADFHEKKWWMIGIPVLYKHLRSIPLFTDDGFRYFLPAYVLGCLECDHERAHDMCSCVMLNLNPINEDGNVNKLVLKRLSSFTREEKIALAQFVEFCCDLDDLTGIEARRSLTYWRQFA